MFLSTIAFLFCAYRPLAQESDHSNTDLFYNDQACKSIRFNAEYLYWRAHQDDLSFAISHQIASDNSKTLVKTKQPKFHYDSGFRLGLAYTSSWLMDFQVQWTHLHTGFKKNSLTTETRDISSVNLVSTFPRFNNSNVNFIGAKWKLKLDYVDFGLYRGFFCHECLFIGLQADLRSISIQQNYQTLNRGTVSAQNTATSFIASKLKNNFYGIGPRLGLILKWNMGWDLSLFTSGGASVLYGKNLLNTDAQFHVPQGNTRVFKYRDDDFNSHAATDFAIGLEWNPHDLCALGWDLGFKLTWEQHIFYSMNRFAESEVLDFVSRHGDLSLQGLTIAADLSF
jgi:hypothetical protein